MTKRIIITEKPSVARDIAAALGLNNRGNGYIYKDNTFITWAYGHLMQLSSPAAYGFESWSIDHLPMLPTQWKFNIVPSDGNIKEKQLQVIQSLCQDADEIICATDAGREGELIFRYIINTCTFKQKNIIFKRLWISSMTDESIINGFKNLQPLSKYDNLYQCALSRAKADWLVGLNLTQLFTILSDRKKGILSIGRVQTPTLSIIAQRYIDHNSFAEQKLYYCVVNFYNSYNEFALRSTSVDSIAELDRLIKYLPKVYTINDLPVITKKVTRPPLLHNLSSLQQLANKRYNMSADESLKVAQALYEKKLITYPRTDSKYISEDIFKIIPKLLAQNINFLPYTSQYQYNIDHDYKVLNANAVNNNKVTDHHAILTTEILPTNLSEVESNIYSLIVERMFEAFHLNHEYTHYAYEMIINNHSFKGTYNQITVPGWKAVSKHVDEDEEIIDASNSGLANIKLEERYSINQISKYDYPTKPKPLFTEATLLAAMEHPNGYLFDAEKSTKELCLGTPATRSAIIEILFKRQYIERKGKSLIPTSKGLILYNTVKDFDFAKVDITAAWESKINDIKNGLRNYQTFDLEVSQYTSEIVRSIANNNNLQFAFDIKDEKEIQCPSCAAIVKLFPKCIKCSSCNFVVFRSVANKELTDAQLIELVSKGKTKQIKGFRGKKGSFDAALELTKEHKINFVFNSK